MSQIAQALAKAKERTGQTTAPFAIPGASAPPFGPDRAAALKQAKRRQRFWIILGLVLIPLTSFVVWIQVRGMLAPSPPDAPAKLSARAQETAPAQMAAPVEPSKAPAAPRPELIQAVANLAISAVTPGDPAKIVLGGRVVRAGQSLDGGLTFVGIVDGQLHFTDAAGALYTRRY